MKKITFNVTEDGSVTYETDGYAGTTCLDAAQGLLDDLEALGVQVIMQDVELKPEAKQGVVVGVKQENTIEV